MMYQNLTFSSSVINSGFAVQCPTVERANYAIVAGGLRDTFDYWHLGRRFDSQPLLNGSFVEMNPSKRIFAVQDEPGWIINYGNLITAIRPLPVIAEPGLIDHF